jgi:long-chain acyl-CoA synthetase
MTTNKVWLKSYPKEIPHELDFSKFESIVDLFEQSFQQNKSLPAFESFGKSLTYEELDNASAQFARFLQFQDVKKAIVSQL